MSPVGCWLKTSKYLLCRQASRLLCALTAFDCMAAEDIANLGFCYSAGIQVVVGEAKVHLWQKGDTP